jgi:hypothetical protein
VIEGRKKLPTAREVMAKTKDMPSSVIKAGAELSKVDPGPFDLQASCHMDTRKLFNRPWPKLLSSKL